MTKKIATLLFLLLAGCTSKNGGMNLTAPGVIRRALTSVSDLSASARLVPRDGSALEAIDLTRGSDGTSFSGFISADPGDYTLEVRFRGLYSGSADRIFLGVWTSDAFSVANGDAASPAFTRRIDPLGDAFDGGDIDGDGLANLDEILAQVSPFTSDSDGDTLDDDEECDPADPNSMVLVAPGGSRLDCDGDGHKRMDAADGQGGDDCNDRNPAVNPASTDVDGDAIDSDCNSSTFPLDDTVRPFVQSILPYRGSVVGCDAKIQATVSDASEVANVFVFFNQPFTSGDRVLAMSRSDGVWSSSSIGGTVRLAPSLEGTEAHYWIRAFDTRNNQTLDEASTQSTIRFDFQVPSATMTISGTGTGPRNVQVTASVRTGDTPTVTLLAIPREDVNGVVAYDGQHAIVLETKTGAVTNFVVQTSADLPAGEYLISPLVSDEIENRLGYNISLPIYQSLAHQGFYNCSASPFVPIPYQIVDFSGSATARGPLKMRTLLESTLTMMAAINSNARLVQITGIGVAEDGTINLAAQSDYTSQWLFGFYDPGQQLHLGITWYAPANGQPFPYISNPAGNLSLTDPIDDVADLIDSDRVASIYASTPMCSPLGGLSGDTIQYSRVDGTDRILAGNSGGGYVSMNAVEPAAVLVPNGNGCN